MRMTQLFGQTLRDAPAEAQVVSHQLLLRAGFIRQLAAGIATQRGLADQAALVPNDRLHPVLHRREWAGGTVPNSSLEGLLNPCPRKEHGGSSRGRKGPHSLDNRLKLG